MKITNNITSFFLIIVFLILSGCKKEWLEEQPMDQLSSASFWKSESDAYLALIGIYRFGIEQNTFGASNYITWQIIGCTDDGIHKGGADDRKSFISPENAFITNQWIPLYRAINKVNVFLSNIDKVNMDDAKKAQYIAEAKFIRAYSYFWLCQWWGGVPLVKDVLSIQEANNLSRNTKQEIVDFCLTEFTAAAADLPASRPTNEKGRILKSAPLVFKGRLLMAEKRWSEAAEAFKQIIDLGVHIIDPRFKELFEEAGESSKEIIFSMERVASIAGNYLYQIWFFDQVFGGYSVVNYFQSTVDAFLMTDGKSIEESPLYDSLNPFKNRDPRLYMSILLPSYTIWEGKRYNPHPDSTTQGVKAGPGRTGYGCKKFTTENYKGDGFSSGADMIFVRYPEVLLGYLESKLEAGDNITQDVLDQTINKVRGRQSVKMSAVTVTDQNTLREIVRRERRVEFLGEPGIRYWDIIRWGIAHTVINGKFYGMKVTNNPATYTQYKVNEKGNILIIDKESFNKDRDYLWPIPLSEIDINAKLVQNPGY